MAVPVRVRSRPEARREFQRSIGRDMAVVLGWAIGLRVLFALLTADTYDPDEFVVLHLSRDFAHGAVPYRDFMFFHPPGMLVLFRILHPLVGWWWPSGRLVVVLIDSATAVLVWRIGLVLYGRRQALIAGLLYGAHPLCLVCGVRIVQDPIITALGLAGLLILLSNRTSRGAVLAGVCLGVALWIKYPAILFLPVYVLAAPRRALPLTVAFLATVAAVFLPFVLEIRALFDQTIVWQLTYRAPSDVAHRLGPVAAFSLLLNPLVLPAALRYRPPLWLTSGFGIAAVFVLASQAYYHYFVPVVPFAALITAPLIADWVWRARKVMAIGAVGLALVWAADIDVGSGPSRLFITAAHISAVMPTVQLLDRLTGPGARILTDQFEYAYLANRSPAGDYFWNMDGVVRKRRLEGLAARADAVVLTEQAGATYPAGFTTFLDGKRYIQIRTPSTRVWLTDGGDGGHRSPHGDTLAHR